MRKLLLAAALLAFSCMAAHAVDEDGFDPVQTMQIYGAADLYCNVTMTPVETRVLIELARRHTGKHLDGGEAAMHVASLATQYRNETAQAGISDVVMCAVIRDAVR